MSLNLVSLSSGSRGNSLVVFSDSAAAVIDVGIASSHIKRGLKDVGITSVPAVLLTHAHSDHVGHLSSFSKNFQPDVYCFSPSYFSVEKEMAGGRLLAFDGDFFVGDLTISPFRVSHDVPCVGYSIYCAGKKISIVTDLGRITEQVFEALKGSSTVFLEANHDENLLLSNPGYPTALKNRILSDKGHLSNKAAAETAVRLAETGTKQIILGHLSEQNNYAELAYQSVASAFAEKGITAGRDVQLDVASFGQKTGIFRVA